MSVEAEVFVGILLFVVVWYVVTDWIERRAREKRRVWLEQAEERVAAYYAKRRLPEDYPTWRWPS